MIDGFMDGRQESNRFCKWTRIFPWLFVFSVCWAFAPAARANSIEWVEKLLAAQEFSELAELLPRVADRYPTNPTILYAQALLNQDAGRAANLFARVVTLQTPYADDALFRLAQYRYHLGHYDRCQQDFAELIKRFPQSELIDDAIYLFSQALMAKGERDSARLFLQSFIKKYPRSPFVDLAILDLESAHMWKTGDPSPLLGSYRIQVGAFRYYDNAKQVAERFAERRFDAEIHAKESLYVVLIGRFADRRDAEAFAHRHRQHFDLGYHIIQMVDR